MFVVVRRRGSRCAVSAGFSAGFFPPFFDGSQIMAYTRLYRVRATRSRWTIGRIGSRIALPKNSAQRGFPSEHSWGISVF
jgi:hypothetical protein